MVKIIGICSGKGGVGKTVLASNLGISLQKMDKKVAIIDFNFTTPHLSLHFGIFSQDVTFNNFLRDEVDIKEAIYNHESGLDIVPSSLELTKIKNLNIHVLNKWINIIVGYKAFDSGLFCLVDN